jgi:hypothetical protein
MVSVACITEITGSQKPPSLCIFHEAVSVTEVTQRQINWEAMWVFRGGAEKNPITLSQNILGAATAETTCSFKSLL